MTYIRVILLFTVCATYAHELPHQINLDIPEICQVPNELNIIKLDPENISIWYTQKILNPVINIEFKARLSESSISYDRDGEEIIACSIYYETNNQNDNLKLCGEVDHFIQAAKAAINVCAEIDEVPYFIGPQSFLDALSEGSLGAHHEEYLETENIEFSCIEPCDYIVTQNPNE